MTLRLGIVGIILLPVLLACIDAAENTIGYTYLSQKMYSKPSISAGGCLDVIDEVKALSWLQHDSSHGSKCMSCGMSQELCPYDPPCQQLIDKLYRECDGVTIPHGAYYDPALTIAGTWGDDVKDDIKISVEKCGCSLALNVRVSWILQVFSALMTMVVSDMVIV